MSDDKQAKNTKLKILHRLKKKTPLLGLSVIEVAILAAVISTGALALSFNRIADKSPVTENSDSADATQIMTTSNKSAAKQEDPPKDNTDTDQSRPAAPSSQPRSNSSPSTPSPDAYGCTTESCRQARQQIIFMEQCDAKISSADSAFLAIVDAEQASYDADKAQQQQYLDSQYNMSELDKGSEMYRWLKYRVPLYNERVAPAWNTYVSTFAGIHAEGCTRVKTFSNPALPVP